MMFILWYMPPGSAPSLASKGQGTPQQDGMSGSDHLCWWAPDWVFSITYIQKENGEICLCSDPHDLNEAICHDHHKTPPVEGSCLWVCALSLIHQVGCPSWILVICSWSGIQPCSQPSTAPSEDTVSCIFPLALSALKTSSRRRWTRS